MASAAEPFYHLTSAAYILAQERAARGCGVGRHRRFLGLILDIDDIAVDLFRRAALQVSVPGVCILLWHSAAG